MKLTPRPVDLEPQPGDQRLDARSTGALAGASARACAAESGAMSPGGASISDIVSRVSALVALEARVIAKRRGQLPVIAERNASSST